MRGVEGAASLELEQPIRRFGAHLAVDQISLAVEPGELIVLLGPSGCGKTTLRMIAGLSAAERRMTPRSPTPL